MRLLGRHPQTLSLTTSVQDNTTWNRTQIHIHKNLIKFNTRYKEHIKCFNVFYISRHLNRLSKTVSFHWSYIIEGNSHVLLRKTLLHPGYINKYKSQNSSISRPNNPYTPSLLTFTKKEKIFICFKKFIRDQLIKSYGKNEPIVTCKTIG